MKKDSGALHRHIPMRWDVEESWYFVTVVTRHRKPFFESATNCQLLMNAFKNVRTRHPYRFGALVIMPEHWHAILKPRTNVVVEAVVGAIKRDVFHISRKQWNNPLQWQPKFLDHRIRNEADYYQHLEYMRLNPGKHGLGDAETWPWFFENKNPFKDEN